MKSNRTSFEALAIVTLVIAIGCPVQILLWGKSSDSLHEAIFNFPALWLVYSFVGGAIAKLIFAKLYREARTRGKV